MGKCCTVFLFLALTGVAFVGYKAAKFWNTVHELPQLEENWWGARPKTDTAIKPFKVQVSEELLKDLKHRLEIAKPAFPALEGINQEYGMNSALLTEILTYWKTKYNWREREKFLNQYPQFTVNVQGLRIHYIHVKPQNTEGKKVLPLLLLHGWPGSVREFYESIPILSKPQKDFVFELIIPSLPGYGFSDGAIKPGLGAIEVAQVFKNLMKQLNFDKYYIQGGDWGAIIVQNMATMYPQHVLGVHSNMCFVNTPKANLKTFLGSFWPSLVVEHEREIPLIYPLSSKYATLIEELGYMHLQATKPDTVGAALRESPVGLAAYIIEKFTTWTNPSWKTRKDGGLLEKFTFDKMLDNIMIYWVSDSITSSMRLYAESFSIKELTAGVDAVPITVPAGCAKFKYELAYQSDYIMQEKYPYMVHSTFYEGGHFAAFEMPKELSQDVINFVTKVEKLPKKTSQKQEL